MSNIKEKLLQIKALVFGADPAPAPVDPAPADPAPVVTDYKLKDGSMVSIDKLEVGGIVTVNAEPAADGEYVLEDGTSITILSGLISEIEIPAAADPIPEDMKQKIAEMEQNFTKQIAELKSLFEDKLKTQAEGVQAMFGLVEEIAETSVQEPTEDPIAWEKMTPLQQFRAQKSKQN